MADISMSDKELLQFAIQNGMIDKALLEEKIEMQKRVDLYRKTSIQDMGRKRRQLVYIFAGQRQKKKTNKEKN